ncbi:hypothetical protein A9Q87_13370 [Flavobacteriales bacterium 34_180_T64]|nr:hypothetical protein A9Q87_13370 [Flavobacteriales bacterium 34_180_T64]
MIAYVVQKGRFLEIYDDNNRRREKQYVSGDLVGHSQEIVLVQVNDFYEVYDENLKRVSKTFINADRFLSVSGNTFSVMKEGYAQVYDANGKFLNKKYIG